MEICLCTHISTNIFEKNRAGVIDKTWKVKQKTSRLSVFFLGDGIICELAQSTSSFIHR